MAGITLAQAQANLDAWVDCSLKVADNQAYTIDVDGSQRTFTRANAQYIDKMIDYWQTKVVTLTEAASLTASGQIRSGRRTRQIVPG